MAELLPMVSINCDSEINGLLKVVHDLAFSCFPQTTKNAVKGEPIGAMASFLHDAQVLRELTPTTGL